jgi:hypothetical protein
MGNKFMPTGIGHVSRVAPNKANRGRNVPASKMQNAVLMNLIKLGARPAYECAAYRSAGFQEKSAAAAALFDSYLPLEGAMRRTGDNDICGIDEALHVKMGKTKNGFRLLPGVANSRANIANKPIRTEQQMGRVRERGPGDFSAGAHVLQRKGPYLNNLNKRIQEWLSRYNDLQAEAKGYCAIDELDTDYSSQFDTLVTIKKLFDEVSGQKDVVFTDSGEIEFGKLLVKEIDHVRNQIINKIEKMRRDSRMNYLEEGKCNCLLL